MEGALKFRLGTFDQLLELTLVAQSATDVRYEAQGSSNGFAGQVHGYVFAASLREWCQALEKVLTHEVPCAKLSSMSPGQMSLTVSSLDSTGHFEGMLETKRHHRRFALHQATITVPVDIADVVRTLQVVRSVLADTDKMLAY